MASAKKEVFGDVGIDMVAGPSEVSIVADRTADPNLVAADLIAQAEHDTNAQSILITNNKNFIRLVNKSLKKQLNKLPKKKIALKSLKNFGLAIFASNKNILEAINTIAPEHLELYTNMNEEIIRGVKNAGSIFIGKFSQRLWAITWLALTMFYPHQVGKIFIRFICERFFKTTLYYKNNKTGIERLGSSVINLAEHENLDGHANSIK